MTLGEHLEELRGRLFKGAVAFGICFAVCWWQHTPLIQATLRPYTLARARLMELRYELYQEKAAAEMEVYEAEKVAGQPAGSAAGATPTGATPTGATPTGEHPSIEPWENYFKYREPRAWTDLLDRHIIPEKPKADGSHSGFFLIMRICTYFSLFISGPYLLLQLWEFIAAGLYKKERRAILKYFPVSVFMFVAGVLFGYFFMVPYGMYFLNRGAPIEIAVPKITVDYFLAFLRSLCLALGVIFQLPLVMTFLGGAGIVPPKMMSKYRGHFIVGAFILAAVITPPDPITQLMMGIPIIILYEMGIWGARIAGRRHKQQSLVPTADGTPGT